MREVVAVVDRPQDIEDEEAISFFGGSEGDADESQGRLGVPRAFQSVIGGLRGAVEVCVYADLPLIQQPFWDVEIVTVPFAPGAQLSRGCIGLWHQV
jgi:hypothetical protein